MKKGILIVLAVLVTCCAYGVAFGLSEFPKAKDYLTEEVVSPVILQRASLPEDYMFPNDWVKQMDWAAIREKFAGTEITVACEGTDIGAPQMFADHFEKLSGIKVKLIGIPPENLFEKLLIAFAARVATYDMIEYYSVNQPTFAPFLEALEPYIEKYKYDWEDWLPLWQELCTLDGKILALPYDCDAQFFLSRAKFLKEIGVDRNPQTWDEVVEYCEKLQNILPEGVYPLGLMAGRNFFVLETFLNVAAPFGMDLLKPGTWEPAMNSEEGVKALDFLKMILEKYCAPGSTTWGYTEHLEAWNAGQFAMCIQYPNQESYNPQMSRIADEERWHSIIPKGPGDKGRFAPEGTYTTSIWGILKNAVNKEAAFLFAAFMSSPEVSFIYTIGGTGLDFGRKSIFEHPLTPKLYPNTQAWLDSAPYFYFFPRLVELPELVNTMVAHVHDALTGDVSSREALDLTAQEWRDILESGGYFGPNAPEPQLLWMQDILAKGK
jgi:multiple sugar transport system substrate-binding protein